MAEEKKIFGVLDDIDTRSLVARGQRDLQATLQIIQETNGLEERIEFKKETITDENDGRDYEYRYFDLEGKGRTYTFVARDSRIGSLILSMITLLCVHKKAPIFTYVHPSATRMLDISALNQFYPLVFYNNEEVEEYFKGEFMFNTEMELTNWMHRRQEYIKNDLVPRSAHKKKRATQRQKTKQVHQQPQQKSNGQSQSAAWNIPGEDPVPKKKVPKKKKKAKKPRVQPVTAPVAIAVNPQMQTAIPIPTGANPLMAMMAAQAQQQVQPQMTPQLMQAMMAMMTQQMQVQPPIGN